MAAGLALNLLGALAAAATMVSFVPQALKVIRERDAHAVSLRMYVITVLGFALWTVYGFMLGSLPLIGSNLVSLALSGLILVLKLRLSNRA